MAVPFGFSVGDFIAVGKLIAQIVDELRQHGEATWGYQSILIELEALQRALKQLQALKPARHELLQLTSIRATVCACQKPLQVFLNNISKFERRLGAFNCHDQRWKGFPRRMQFRLMFKDDIKELRCFLASHIATINILLMTQVVSSISVAGEERCYIASSLESKILASRRLLDNIRDNVDVSLEQQRHMQDDLHQQHSTLENLGSKSDELHVELQRQANAMEEVHVTTEHMKSQAASILYATTQILALVTSGPVRMQKISQKLNEMVQHCTSFTIEMRAAMLRILKLFSDIHSMLQRIERSLPTRPQLPIIEFTTALGETLALPYQLCQQWTTFTELLKVVFHNKPGSNRVLSGMYHIMNARHRRIIEQYEWQYVIAQDDQLTMSMIMDELVACADTCPYPTCQASIADAQDDNGGRTCGQCKRWSANSPNYQQHIVPQQTEVLKTPPSMGPRTNSRDLACPGTPSENVELYRHIHVLCVPADIIEEVQEEPTIERIAYDNKGPGPWSYERGPLTRDVQGIVDERELKYPSLHLSRANLEAVLAMTQPELPPDLFRPDY